MVRVKDGVGSLIEKACLIGVLLLCGVLGFASDAVGSAPHQARIKDIASIEGIRDNQLVGYGDRKSVV